MLSFFLCLCSVLRLFFHAGSLCSQLLIFSLFGLSSFYPNPNYESGFYLIKLHGKAQFLGRSLSSMCIFYSSNDFGKRVIGNISPRCGTLLDSFNSGPSCLIGLYFHQGALFPLAVKNSIAVVTIEARFPFGNRCY